MFQRDRACLNKRRYDTKEEATAAIKRGGCRFELTSYRCPFGDHWHMTKVRPFREYTKRLSK